MLEKLAMRRQVMRLGTLVGSVFFLFITAQAQEPAEVTQKTFCFRLNPITPTCDIPVPRFRTSITLDELPTDDEGNRFVYFWTSIYVVENIEVMHVWYSTNDKEPWAQTVHFHWIDRTVSLYNNLKVTAIGVLRTIFGSHEDLHDLQALGFTVKPRSLNRWATGLTITPGIYSVEVRDLNGNLIKGGEKVTVEVVR